MLGSAALSRSVAAFRGTKIAGRPKTSSRPITAWSKTQKSAKRLFSSDEVEERFKKYGFDWPGAVRPKANYLGIARSGSLMFISGHLPYNPPSQSEMSTLVKGKVGKDVTKEDGAKAAQYCAVALLGTLRDHINNWDHVRKIVRVTGYVNCPDGYEPISEVINGASDLIVDVLGEQRGLHARSAVGVASLPFNAAVEVEMIVELDDQFA